MGSSDCAVFKLAGRANLRLRPNKVGTLFGSKYVTGSRMDPGCPSSLPSKYTQHFAFTCVPYSNPNISRFPPLHPFPALIPKLKLRTPVSKSGGSLRSCKFPFVFAFAFSNGPNAGTRLHLFRSHQASVARSCGWCLPFHCAASTVGFASALSTLKIRQMQRFGMD